MKKLISKEYAVTQLMNPRFEYVNASQTDIRKTFERVTAKPQELPDVVISPRSATVSAINLLSKWGRV